MTVVIGIDPKTDGFDAFLTMDGEPLRAYTARAGEGIPTRLIPESGVVAAVYAETVTMMHVVLDSAAAGDNIYVFVEAPLVAGARNIRTSLKMAMAVGAIVSGVTRYTFRCYLVPVSKWKMATIGTGNASKDQVALWLNQVHPTYAGLCGVSQDLIDAACIARYGLGIVNDSTLV